MPTKLVLGLVFAFAFAGLAVLTASSVPDSPFTERSAVRAALADSETRAVVDQQGYSDVRVTAIDDELTRVSFFDGDRIVFEAAIDDQSRLAARANYLRGYRYGTELSNRAPVLALLTAVFLLATLTLPLRNQRNLDALALAAFVVPVALLNERYLDRSVVTAYLLLAYLGWRCIQRGLLGHEPAPAGRPLLVEPAVRLVAGGALVLTALITLTSTNVIDVGYASMNGATLLSNGTVPYGHITDVIHGDTYPLLAYALYLPAAWIEPVHDIFDSTDGALIITAAAVIVAAAAFFRAERADADRGPRSVVAWLAFPPVLLTASSGSNDIVFAALVAWALALWLHAGRSTAAWTAAAWVKVVPLAVLPLWLARYRDRREETRAWAGLSGVTLVSLVWLVAIGGFDAIGDMVSGISYQFERRSLYSMWTLLDLDNVRVVFQAALVALIARAALAVRREELDRSRVAALAGAVLIAAQLAGNYWAITYLAWTFPCVYFALLSGSAGASPRAAGPAR